MRATLIPPPLVAAAVAASMWGVDALLPVARLLPPGRTWFAGALLAAGLWLMLAAVWRLGRAGTTADPFRPERASCLVTDGVFARSRNPVYLGDVLLLAAWAVWLGNLVALPLPALFVAWMERWQIPAEEAALRARFGPRYAAYRARVRRWFGRR